MVFHHLKIRTHINGIDLVKDTVTNDWVILEDNLRVPSGASYPYQLEILTENFILNFLNNLKLSYKRISIDIERIYGLCKLRWNKCSFNTRKI